MFRSFFLKLDCHSISALTVVFEEVLYPSGSGHAQVHTNLTQKRLAEVRIIRNNFSVIDIQLYLPPFDSERTSFCHFSLFQTF